eukprot:sb/3478370/
MYMICELTCYNLTTTRESLIYEIVWYSRTAIYRDAREKAFAKSVQKLFFPSIPEPTESESTGPYNWLITSHVTFKIPTSDWFFTCFGWFLVQMVLGTNFVV